MARVYRKTYSQPIPPGSDRVRATVRRRGKAIEVDAVRFKGDGGKWVVAPVVETGPHAGTHCLIESPTWYGRVGGKPVPLCSNKAAAEVMLADKVRERERGEAGLVDPFEAHRKRPLTEHLADFEAVLRAKGGTAFHVDQTVARVRKSLVEGCGFSRLDDLRPEALSVWLARRQVAGDNALPEGKEEFTVAEAAKALGIKPGSVSSAVRRFRLEETRKGKVSSLSRATVEELRARGSKPMSQQTRNHYLAAIRSFGRWLGGRGKRLPENPFAHLELGRVVERKHDRRELLADELTAVLVTARASKRTFRGLTGEDRFHLYALACRTGFRASALAALTPECFLLDDRVPVVVMSARSDKSRRGKNQPLPPDVADLMRSYLQGKPSGKPIWPGRWAKDRKGAEMLRHDLVDAGIDYIVEGPNGPEHADFHALRHSYLTEAGRSIPDLRRLQELAGHSTSKLTERYTHVRLHDLAGAVEKLPSILPETRPDGASEVVQPLRATGSDGPALAPGTPVSLQSPCSQLAHRLPAACPPLAHEPDSKGRKPMGSDNPSSSGPVPGPGRKPLSGRELRAKRGVQTGPDGIPPAGFEPATLGLGNPVRQDARDDEARSCGETEAALAFPLPSSPDLARIVEAWPELPLHIRTSILALIDAARR